jgi:hypothetical protein
MESRRHLPGAVLIVLLAAIVLVGCFGGGSSNTTATTGGTAATSATTDPDIVQNTVTSGTQLVNGLPAEYVASLGQRPIVVLFYVPGGAEDEKVLKSVLELRSIYTSYTFLVFDYRKPALYGDLCTELGISYQPQIVLIDRYGIPSGEGDDHWNIWSGYVDKATLNQALVNLGRE